MTNELTKEETQEITKATSAALTPPKAGDPTDKLYEGKRVVWDSVTGKWRYVSAKHCPPDINPLTYTPVQPFQTVERKLSNGNRERPKMILVDANGVPVGKNGKVNLAYFPHAVDLFVVKNLLRAKGTKLGGRRLRNYERAMKFLMDVARDEENFKKYLDDQGNVKPEAAIGMFMAMWQWVNGRPEIMGRFLEQQYRRSYKNPVGEFERYLKIVGAPFAINQNQGTQVTLNITNLDEPEERPNFIQAEVIEDVKGE